MELGAWRNAVIFVVAGAALAMLFGGCASRGPDAPAVPAAAARPPGATSTGAGLPASASTAATALAPNATVRSVTYREAAPNVAPAPAARAGSTKTAAPNKNAKAPARRSRTTAASKAPTSAGAATAAAPAARASAASGWRYTYSVELDSGGMRQFGFADDQGLAVLDRVIVDGERLVVPAR